MFEKKLSILPNSEDFLAPFWNAPKPKLANVCCLPKQLVVQQD